MELKRTLLSLDRSASTASLDSEYASPTHHPLNKDKIQRLLSGEHTPLHFPSSSTVPADAARFGALLDEGDIQILRELVLMEGIPALATEAETNALRCSLWKAFLVVPDRAADRSVYKDLINVCIYFAVCCDILMIIDEFTTES
jgi:hypothetical protein